MIDKEHIKEIIRTQYRGHTNIQLANDIAEYMNKEIQSDDPKFDCVTHVQDRRGNFSFIYTRAFAEVLKISGQSYVIVIAEHHTPHVFEYGDVIVHQYDRRKPLENVL